MSAQLRTPLARVRGLGSAKSGTHHWLVQRLTSIALLPLTVWFLYAALELVGGEYADARSFLAQPWNAVLMAAFVLMLFYHAKLGIQVILEDYVHLRWLEVTSQMINLFACAFAALVALFAIVRIALGA
ncbi:MAG TPA: succinate dehydrogenase, hydrophobic membrane anchor protein [Xanthomonadales bacterium]|nr:succinate dehydrogenase, hydrophobic membrane anchor protein [Xanthomonadales bacterium]